MYASIRKYGDVHSPAETAHRVEQSFVPVLQGLPGFKGYYLVDAEDGIITVSLFESREAALASAEKAAAWVRENMVERHGGAPPEIAAGEVRVAVSG
jgi:hypothetical protein